MNPCEVFSVPVKQETGALVPINSGEEKCAPGHAWGAGVRSAYLVHYVFSGKGIFYCGPQKYTLHKGQIFVIFPGTVVKYQADDKDPWHYAWVNFAGDEAKEIFRCAQISISKPVADVEKPEELCKILRQMPQERSADVRSNLKFSMLLYAFLSLLLPDVQVSQKNENQHLDAAIQYIEAHYADPITVDKIAAQICISRKYLFAIFKKAKGLSPQAYIIDYRIHRAEALLMDPSLSVANIAYSVGYKDPLTFSKMFKIKTGLSPSEYRERQDRKAP